MSEHVLEIKNISKHFAGVKALEDGAFRGTVIDAVTKAYEKTINLKK